MRALNRLRLGAALWLLATSAVLPQTISGGGSSSIVIAQKYVNNALTGTTSETNQAAIRIPANSLGANGAIRLTFNATWPNNANTKTVTLRYTQTAGATSGGQLFATSATTSTAGQFLTIIRAANATNSQTTLPAVNSLGSGLALAQVVTTVDTTQDSYLNINGTLGVGTDTLTLVGYTAEVLYAQ